VASQMQIGRGVHQLERVHQVEFFSVGSTIVSWYNRKKIFVALISAEVDYMASRQATCEAIWMRMILV